MARLWMAGAEIDAGAITNPTADPPAGGNPVDGTRVGGGTLSRDTAIFRSGSASWKFDSTASNFSSAVNLQPVTFVDGRTYFFRIYVRATTAPLTGALMLAMGGTSTPSVHLRTDGAIELWASGLVQGSPSAAIVTDSNWHRVELSVTATATGNWGSAELRLDGVTVATLTGAALPRVANTFSMGWSSLAPGASRVLNIDDAALNDSTGSVNNTWCGGGSVLLLKPTADSAKGTGWTNDNASSISLFPSVSNTPPTGITDTTAGGGTHQLRNATSNANVSYDATMTTYAAAGVPSSAVINAVQCWVATAAPIGTSPKAGTVGIVSNPAVANINLGLPASPSFYANGLADVYGLNWKWSPGTMSEAPAVTRGTAPVMRITQVTASTRVAMVCGMFIYVDYSPAADPAARKPSHKNQVAIMRASLQ